MKLHIGSIQRKNKWCYFVHASNGKQKWLALHTQSIATAKRRVAELDTTACHDEKKWLEYLILRGEAARTKLNRLQTTFTWEELWAHFTKNALPALPKSGEISYRRWLEILKNQLAPLSPADISEAEASSASRNLYHAYRSAPRMLRFYKRLWRTTGLNAAVWGSVIQHSLKPSSRYRRLSMTEIRRAARHLKKKDPRLYAVFVIGYYSGLRLSDIVELSKDEISDDPAFLLLVPNKVRTRRPTLLRIPLIHEARAIVERREKLSSARLFPRLTSQHVSKRIRRIFNTLGILNTDVGIASFHSLRATFISLMDDANVSPHITDAITGHASGGMHARYSQPSKEALMDGVLKGIPPLDALPTRSPKQGPAF